jgi:uncharacterized DUF497 family protein
LTQSVDKEDNKGIKTYMIFEFDSHKSDSNKVKHGIDFNEAKALWDDPNLLEIPVKTSDEQRLFYLCFRANIGQASSLIGTAE